jgi:flagellar hook-basal body complex protein FliE
MVTPLVATKAYAAVQKFAGDPGEMIGAAPDKASGPSFPQLVRDAISQAVDSTKTAETQMVAHAKGKADLIDVVTAVSNAQTSLQAVMAVRDQVIASYQQILSMQI